MGWPRCRTYRERDRATVTLFNTPVVDKMTGIHEIMSREAHKAGALRGDLQYQQFRSHSGVDAENNLITLCRASHCIMARTF